MTNTNYPFFKKQNHKSVTGKWVNRVNRFRERDECLRVTIKVYEIC